MNVKEEIETALKSYKVKKNKTLSDEELAEHISDHLEIAHNEDEKYGCFMRVGEDSPYNYCVIDIDDRGSCNYAETIQNRDHCRFWKKNTAIGGIFN